MMFRMGTIALMVILTLSLAQCQERIDVLIAGNIDLINALRVILGDEMLVSYRAIPCRLGGVVAYDDAMKFIRLYFPRTYPEMLGYDVLMLTQPEYNLFTAMQDKWMHDAIEEGMGGINDGSVFSIQSTIHVAWANSLAQRAFPNDARAVSQRGGGEAGRLSFRIVVNRNHPVPVLTPFIPLGVEGVACTSASRLVIPREGSGILAHQVGNFPALGEVPYLVEWDYGRGRAMTSGDFMGNGWFGVPRSPDSNQYSPDILMNMMLHLTHRKLIDDIVVFHRIKAHFTEFRSRMVVLTSLRDFIDAFGANTREIEAQIRALEEMCDDAVGDYMGQEYGECESEILAALSRFSETERLAVVEKNKALAWVYAVEWLVTTSTLTLSCLALWTLMVKRRLYREAGETRSSSI